MKESIQKLCKETLTRSIIYTGSIWMYTNLKWSSAIYNNLSMEFLGVFEKYIVICNLGWAHLGSPRDHTLTSPRNHTLTSPRPIIPSPHLDFLINIFIPPPHLDIHTLASPRLFDSCFHTLTSPRFWFLGIIIWQLSNIITLPNLD